MKLHIKKCEIYSKSPNCETSVIHLYKQKPRAKHVSVAKISMCCHALSLSA